jgi:class 3 adenylate cyclase
MTGAAPSGVVTFLFTDVEGSTRRWEADAEGMRKALASHDEALRSTIEAHGGWLFKHFRAPGQRAVPCSSCKNTSLWFTSDVCDCAQVVPRMCPAAGRAKPAVDLQEGPMART